MKVILLKDVPALGRKNEVKEVSGGYARNFLLPRGLVVAATDSAVRALESDRAREERKKEDEEKHYRAAADKLRNAPVMFRIKTGEKGKAFGSVSAAKITDALKKQGISIEKNWVILDSPIKTTGEKSVPVRFPRGIAGEIKINIVAE